MLELDGQRLTLEEVAAVALGDESVSPARAALERMERAREVVERIVESGRAIYGVNTGFGRLADVRIEAAELRELQLNLVRSHACGVGQPLSEAETRAMMLLRANVLALGRSGARPLLLETLAQMLERGVHPLIPEKGSVGASGDLAPLAHLALVLIGEGEALYRGARVPGAEAMRRAGLEPVRLDVKEGLALLNGTQAMCAVGGLALYHAERLARTADVTGAMTLEALRGTPVAFDERIHSARMHLGQQETAAHLRELLDQGEVSPAQSADEKRVQDAYSLRCMPQVHGAVRGALAHARSVLETETGAATDNPLVFAEEGEVLSGGNFHGAPLALALDYAAIALTDLMSIAERRIDSLVNPDLNHGLPPFLTEKAGTSSGFMLAHVAAVALLNEAKVLAHPASVDSLPTSGGREDHVSMGMTSALKLRSIVENAEHLFAIELLAAGEGLEYRGPRHAGRGVRRAYAALREQAARLAGDRSLSPDIQKLAALIRRGEFDF